MTRKFIENDNNSGPHDYFTPHSLDNIHSSTRDTKLLITFHFFNLAE